MKKEYLLVATAILLLYLVVKKSKANTALKDVVLEKGNDVAMPTKLTKEQAQKIVDEINKLNPNVAIKMSVEGLRERSEKIKKLIEQLHNSLWDAKIKIDKDFTKTKYELREYITPHNKKVY